MNVAPETFSYSLVVAGAVLAFWIAARFPASTPSNLTAAGLHLLCGLAGVRAIPALADAVTALSAGVARVVVPFAVGLPLLTYAFLTGLWLTRAIHRSLSGFPH